MKGLFFVLAFIGFVGFSNVNAQSCCAKKTASVEKVSNEDIQKAASLDKTIKVKKDKDGSVTYTRKEKDPVTGKKVHTPVVYDAATAKFVNAPAATTGKACAGEMKDGKECSKMGGAASNGSCCSKKGSASVDTPKPAEASSKM